MATATPELHIVVAALEGRGGGEFIGYCAVSAPLTYDEALNKWEGLEAARRNHMYLSGTRSNKGHVRHYAVRSIADPRFAPLVSRGYANGVRRSDGFPNGTSGLSKAARAWAKLHGYVGKAGGWIYGPDGKPYIQGWDTFGAELSRRNEIARGSDRKWYLIDKEMVQ